MHKEKPSLKNHLDNPSTVITATMAGTASQTPVAAPSTRPAHNQAALDFINGNGPLPDSPASSSAAAPPTSKKTKGKKAADPNETGKLLAAKINQLELDAAGDKEVEAEIGGSNSLSHSLETARYI